MTPFDSWYAAHIAPALKDAPAAAQKAAKASAAEIWNAALDAVMMAKEPYRIERGGTVTLMSISDVQLKILRAEVTP